MPKQDIPFGDFLVAAGLEHNEFISQLHGYLQDNDCVWTIRLAANGHVVAYVHKPTKRTVANFLFRKKLPMLRIYVDNIRHYENKVDKWPDAMKDAIRKGGNCSRLSNPNACNSRCLQGFDFMLDGERQQKCRCHMAFTFLLDDETKPHLLDAMVREMEARK